MAKKVKKMRRCEATAHGKESFAKFFLDIVKDVIAAILAALISKLLGL